jgi:predicted ATPase
MEDVREQYAMTMSLDMAYLAAKLSRVSNPQFPTYEQYARSCKEILGFVVTSTPSQNGQRAGIYLPSQETIPIDQMGDGVPNIVQLLVNLATSKGKIFLMEEPENDLHPHALKALLDLILESAKHNQFVISTHSNIVVSHLCSEPGSRLHRVSSTRGELPTTASINVVGPTPVERLETLTELGYAFSDLGLWDGWLIL